MHPCLIATHSLEPIYITNYWRFGSTQFLNIFWVHPSPSNSHHPGLLQFAVGNPKPINLYLPRVHPGWGMVGVYSHSRSTGCSHPFFVGDQLFDDGCHLRQCGRSSRRWPGCRHGRCSRHHSSAKAKKKKHIDRYDRYAIHVYIRIYIYIAYM